MNINLKGSKIAIIGGGTPCKKILEILLGPGLSEFGIQVLVVADTLMQVEGIEYAKEVGIHTTTEYSDICKLSGLNLILKLKNDEQVAKTLDRVDLEKIELIDLDIYQTVAFLSFLRIEEEKIKIKNQISDNQIGSKEMAGLFENFSNRINQIADRKNQYLLDERHDQLEMEKEYFQIIQGSMIPTFIINTEHIITHWNRACEELTGHNAYELVGTDKQWVPFRSAKRPTMADVIVGEMPEEEVTKYYGGSWRKSALINEAYEAEEFFPHLGEEGKWIFFTAAPIKAPDGKIIGAIQTLSDRTEDRRAHEEIELQDKELSKLYNRYKISEKKYRSLFNNNPNPIFIFDYKTFEILDVNHRVEAEYGFKKLDLLGKSFLEIGDKDDETISEGLKSLFLGDNILFTKKKHYKSDKKSFFVNIKVVNAEYTQREVFIASVTDITESVEKETQLIQAGKLATLGTMAAGMAHEINQPLNVIQICADLMLKMIKKGIPIPDDELTLMANDIIDNVGRAAGVIKHVRDFARQSERDLKKLALNDPINDVFKVLGHQLTVHSIKVDLDLDPDLPQIRAEHNRLEQVYINLVTNAIDSMDEKADKSEEPVEKRLTIKTFCEGNKVISTVMDTGIGMSNEVKRKIFEPFFTTKETGKGTGLGTSISFGIVKDYGGVIEIESEVGKGATFIVKFPAVE
ncbi:MAG: PAS domain S-box protein [Desulfobacteraceae bacterium]|nr:PAS domain S-box protein [Desulfobacteraceae bacterium]